MSRFAEFYLMRESQSEVHGMIQNIIQTPHDVFPWQVLADYYDDAGDAAQAKVIRDASELVPTGGEDTVDNVCQKLNKEPKYKTYYWTMPQIRIEVFRNLTGYLNFMTDWIQRRPDISPFLLPGRLTEEILENALPRGGGLNYRWNIDQEGGNYVCNSNYRCMDDNGYGIGSLGIIVTVPIDDVSNFDVEWTDPQEVREMANRHEDFYGDGILEDISSQVAHALRPWRRT